MAEVDIKFLEERRTEILDILYKNLIDVDLYKIYNDQFKAGLKTYSIIKNCRIRSFARNFYYFKKC
jgi:hypothetical protein